LERNGCHCCQGSGPHLGLELSHEYDYMDAFLQWQENNLAHFQSQCTPEFVLGFVGTRHGG